MTDSADPKQRPAHLFKPGQSGNPNGRPKGSRNAFGEAFMEAFVADFTQITTEGGKCAGALALAKVRETEPGTYMRVAAGILPKEVVVKDELSDVSDEELAALIFAAREAISRAQSGRGEAGVARSKKSTRSVPTIQ